MARGRVPRADKRWAKSIRAPYPWEVAPDCYWWSGDFGRTASDAASPAFTADYSAVGLAGWPAATLTEDTSNGTHLIYKDSPTNSVPGVVKVTADVTKGSRDWVWLQLSDSYGYSFFNLATGAIGTTSNGSGSSAVASIAPISANRWQITVQGNTTTAGPASIRIGGANADNSRSYLGTGATICTVNSIVFSQQRHSALTSQRAGGVAGAALSQATPGSQPFSQVDDSSPGGLSVFGKPCLWSPAKLTYMTSSDAGILGQLNSNIVACCAIVNVTGLTGRSYAFSGTSGYTSFLVENATKAARIRSGANYFTHPNALTGTHVVYYQVNKSAGTALIVVDGVSSSGAFAHNGLTEVGALLQTDGMALRETLLSATDLSGLEPALRAGMLARLV